MYILYIYLYTNTLKFEIGKSTQNVGLGMGAVAYPVKLPLGMPISLIRAPDPVSNSTLIQLPVDTYPERQEMMA